MSEVPQLTKLTPLGRCTCPHDYYHGDGHYIACPATTNIDRWPLEVREGEWRPAWGEFREEVLRQRKLGIEIEAQR